MTWPLPPPGEEHQHQLEEAPGDQAPRQEEQEQARVQVGPNPRHLAWELSPENYTNLKLFHNTKTTTIENTAKRPTA